MIFTETRERFVRAILDHVPVERIVALHFFSPLRQGGVESGVAVVAALPDGPHGNGGGAPALSPANEGVADHSEMLRVEAAPSRLTVYTARYRLVLKGPERGKWETSVVAEADAPLLTVEAVVHGVQRRAGDDNAPELITGDELRRIR